MRNRYANNEAIKWYIKEFTSGTVQVYNAPHGYNTGTGDIWNMWDTLILDKIFKRIHFIQICSKSNRSTVIKEHDLLNPDKYVFCSNINYILLTFDKVKGRYNFEVFYLNPKQASEKQIVEVVKIN